MIRGVKKHHLYADYPNIVSNGELNDNADYPNVIFIAYLNRVCKQISYIFSFQNNKIPYPFISTCEKQQLPTPHRHHSRPEMDSMPRRSTRHQPSSLLLGLPQDLRIEIVARVSATSERPWLTSAAYAVLA
jgi:hypothetical protein